jgi:hypothetical protein
MLIYLWKDDNINREKFPDKQYSKLIFYHTSNTVLVSLLSLLSSPSLVTALSFLALLLNRRRSPLHSLKVSDCSTLRTLCDVPGIAVFCSESLNFFLPWLPNHSLKPLLLLHWFQLVPYYHSHVQKLLYRSSCSASFT